MGQQIQSQRFRLDKSSDSFCMHLSLHNMRNEFLQYRLVRTE